VAQQTFQSPKGPFKATLSLGIATYTEDGREKAELIAHSDQCLYAAKHGGRNRTVCYADIASQPAAKLKVAK
jgi:PleD family two-component response regulator